MTNAQQASWVHCVLGDARVEQCTTRLFDCRVRLIGVGLYGRIGEEKTIVRYYYSCRHRGTPGEPEQTQLRGIFSHSMAGKSNYWLSYLFHHSHPRNEWSKGGTVKLLANFIIELLDKCGERGVGEGSLRVAQGTPLSDRYWNAIVIPHD